MSSATDYYSGTAVPPTSAYGPPAVDFSNLSGALDSFVKGRQQGREEDTARAFRNGIPYLKDQPGSLVRVLTEAGVPGLKMVADTRSLFVGR
jgi:hypothetical protein